MVFEESVVVTKPFEEALAEVKKLLAAEGFGTLTEIDLQATLQEKVGKQIGRYVILGACNPELASRAIDVEPQVGVLLPCNVVVREVPSGVLVEAMDPGIVATFVEREEMRAVVGEARRLIGNALGLLSLSAA